MEKVKAELAETRKHLKYLTRYAIGHLTELLKKYGPLYKRRTRKSRFDEVTAKEVAFKSFHVTYDRDKGYVGHKINGGEFGMDCSKFDKLLLMFKDGHYKVVDLPEKLFVGPDLVYCGLPERERVFTLAYTNRDATYLKRFTFGGTILNKAYHCIPPKSKILFLEPDTPELLYIRYKPAPYQKINQQTCKPSEVEVKGPKTRGRQISIKDVSSITSKPTRGWKEDEATTMLPFT
jgi:topoisomerase-4 subunit A